MMNKPRPIPLKPFYMIRHGQTEANAARIMAGSIDSPLTELGREQAKHAQRIVALLKVKPAAVFHSHLSRARDTANIINEALDVKTYEDPNLGEIHAGQLEGAPYEECEDLFNGWPIIEGGEHPNEFFTRVKHGKSNAIKRYNEPVLIVCHGGVMRAFGEIHGISIPGRFQNAHLYEFIPNQEKQHFPWDVFDYDLCEKTENLTRKKSDIYEYALASQIAS